MKNIFICSLLFSSSVSAGIVNNAYLSVDVSLPKYDGSLDRESSNNAEGFDFVSRPLLGMGLDVDLELMGVPDFKISKRLIAAKVERETVSSFGGAGSFEVDVQVNSAAFYGAYRAEWPYVFDAGILFVEASAHFNDGGTLGYLLPGVFARLSLQDKYPKISADLALEAASFGGEGYLDIAGRVKYKVWNRIGLDGYLYALVRFNISSFKGSDGFGVGVPGFSSKSSGLGLGFEFKY